MELFIAIFINLVIIGTIGYGIIKGIKDRANFSFIKLITNITNIVGTFLLTNLLMKEYVMSFILKIFNDVSVNLSLVLFGLAWSITFAILVLIFNRLVALILTASRNKKYLKMLTAKEEALRARKRNKAVVKVEKTKRQERRDFKLARKKHFREEKRAVSRTFGAIIGALNGIVISFVIILFSHFIALSIQPITTYNPNIYENSIYGVVDKDQVVWNYVGEEIVKQLQE